jgi:DNA-binding MarR family transcriptional regulator
MSTNNVEVLKKSFLSLFRVIGNHAQTAPSCCGATLPQCDAIMEIGLAHRINIRELSEILQLDKSTMSRTIQGLVEDGLVERTVDEHDRRYVVLTLKPKGMAIFRQINSFWDGFCGDLLKNITAKKHKQVFESLAIIVDALIKNDMSKKCLEQCCTQK